MLGQQLASLAASTFFHTQAKNLLANTLGVPIRSEMVRPVQIAVIATLTMVLALIIFLLAVHRFVGYEMSLKEVDS